MFVLELASYLYKLRKKCLIVLIHHTIAFPRFRNINIMTGIIFNPNVLHLWAVSREQAVVREQAVAQVSFFC